MSKWDIMIEEWELDDEPTHQISLDRTIQY